MKGIIYCATSPSSNRYYGYSSLTLEERKINHLERVKRGNKCRFFTAIRKYGEENFIWEIIEEHFAENKKDLHEILTLREKFWIQKEKTYLREYGYNMTDGGEGTAGLKRTFSEEHRKKLSISHLGKTLTQEHKDNIGKSGEGRIFSEEHKRNLTKNWDLTHPNNGKDPSEETRDKLRQKSLNVKKIICEHCQKEFTPWGLKRHQTKIKNICHTT